MRDDIDVQTNLYERYVDDINIMLKKVTPGARYVDGRLVITKESIDIDQGKKDDEITFEFIKTVGNSIHRSIQLEVDVPSNYEDGKLPILDLKVWIGQVENNVYKVIHEHYTKEIASKYVIDQKSAMSMQQKRPILTQMCLKVLLNNSEYLDEIKKKEKVEFFMRRMQASGYNSKMRYEILKSAMNAYDKIKNNSLCPMFRGKEQNTPKKRSENKKKKRSWFRKGGYESVLFVQATPNSSLMKRIRNEIETSNIKIKVIERSGTKVKKYLQKNDPFKQKTCNDKQCFVCETSKKGNCQKSSITYEIKCKGDCGGHVYFGETHKNAYVRGKEHIFDYRKKLAKSVMWKHCKSKHQGTLQEFEMRVVDCSRGDPMMRQILESIRINKEPEERRINDKTEWNIGKIPQAEINNG